MNYYLIFVKVKTYEGYYQILKFDNEFEYNKHVMTLKIQGLNIISFGKIDNFYEGLQIYFYLDPFKIDQIEYYRMVYVNKQKIGIGKHIDSNKFEDNMRFHHNTFKKINVSINFLSDSEYSTNSIYLTKKINNHNDGFELFKTYFQNHLNYIPENFKKIFLKTLQNTAKEHRDFFVKKCNDIINYDESILNTYLKKG